MKQIIEKYVNQGFYIFPCDMQKRPLTTRGFKDATNDIEVLKYQFYKDEMLIGLPCGKINNIVVIDFDMNKPLPDGSGIDTRSFEELYEAAAEYGELPDTYTVETPGTGRHLYYLTSPESPPTVSRARFLNKSLAIDIRGDGGYVIAADEKYYFPYDDFEGTSIDDIRSKCAQLPDWIYGFTRENLTQTELAEILPPSEIREIRSALSFIPSDDRDLWIRCGMALKSTGSPSGFGLWQEFSQKSDKYNPAEMERRWRGLKPKDITIASIFHEAARYGWVTTYENAVSVPCELQTPESISIKAKQQEIKKKAFPQELLHPPGLVGDIADYILSKSHIPQPVFALSAALCAVGTLAGRKVQSESGIRTNLYCVNVGGSGSGKDMPRKIIKSLFALAGCGAQACVDTIASDSAVETALHRTPAQLFLLDEIGKFFRSTQSKGASSYITNVVSVLLRLFSACDELYFCKEYADETRKREIDQPHLCLLGSTVHESLYKGLNYESATDGFLSRLLIFETDDNLPRKQKISVLRQPSSRILEQMVALRDKKINVRPAGNVDEMDHPEPQIVHFSGNAEIMLDRFEDRIFALRQELQSNKQIDAMYNRAAQMAVQIALTVATGVNIDNPVITEHEMNYGISLAKHLTDHLKFITDNYMARNDYEHEVKNMFNIIAEAGSISLAEIARQTQHLGGYQRDAILENLKDSDQIEERLVGNISFQTRMFFLKS